MTTRAQIVSAADGLFYENGFEHTSFSDIAAAVNISRGNFYYHFKSKDDILDAVIAKRLDDTRQMLKRWESAGDTPADRIRSFIEILNVNGKKIKRYGCPVGSLSSELLKLNHVSKAQANKLFTLFRAWLRRQFVQMGCQDNADTLAMHVLAFSQGVATLGSAFGDEKFMQQEVKLMNEWLDGVIKTVSAKA